MKSEIWQEVGHGPDDPAFKAHIVLVEADIDAMHPDRYKQLYGALRDIADAFCHSSEPTPGGRMRRSLGL